MTSMTAVVKAAAGPGAEIDQVDVPEPKGADVLIEVAASSICGTDVHIFDWNEWAQRHIKPPRVFGNEVHAATAGALKDNAVAIFGLGPIGLCAVGIARAEGAAAVYGVEPNPYRRELAERMGATAVLAPSASTVDDIRKLNGGVGVDVVLEMSGHPVAIEQGLQVLHRGGWISLLGIGDEPVTLDLNDLVVTKGITIYGIFGRRIWDTWERTSSYLSTGKVDVSPLITHRFPLDDFQEAMAQMKSGRSGKVVLLPNGG